MGHTVYPMRWAIYEKMEQLKKLSKALREPDKKIADELINNLFLNISAISYANPLPNELENNLIFSMLLQEKKKGDSRINDLTLLFLSMMIIYKENKIKYPDENDIHRLLRQK